MKNLSIGSGIFLFVLTLMFGFSSSLFASDPVKMDTVLTDKPADSFDAATPKDVFSTDTPVIYILWKSDQVKLGQKIKSVWIADDTNNVAPANYKIDEATFELNQDFKNKMLSSLPGSFMGGTAQMSKPNSGWPAGKYHVELYVNDALVKSVNFSIAAAGAPVSASAAAPAAAAIPASAPAATTPPEAPVTVATSVAAPVPAAAGSKWGAISVDSSPDAFYGVGSGDSKDEANKTAQKFCGSAGGKSCGVVLSYQQCGAYATSESGSGKGEGSTQKAAEAAAIKDCKTADCKILTSDCNE